MIDGDYGRVLKRTTFPAERMNDRTPPPPRAAADPIRRMAWQALSALFLDTELDDASIAAIARELAKTGCSVEELERIYEEEVAPACWRNLRALPGGVWTGFQEDWLVQAIDARMARRGAMHDFPLLKRWSIHRWTRDTRHDWYKVKRHLEHKPSLQCPSR